MSVESSVVAAGNEAVIVVADVCDLAARWGREDAEAGLSRRGSVWFLIGSRQWKAYNKAYHRETAGRPMSEGVAL